MLLLNKRQNLLFRQEQPTSTKLLEYLLFPLYRITLKEKSICYHLYFPDYPAQISQLIQINLGVVQGQQI